MLDKVVHFVGPIRIVHITWPPIRRRSVCLWLMASMPSIHLPVIFSSRWSAPRGP